MTIFRTKCKPTILDNDILMSEDDDFLTKQKIKAECDCINKNTCLAIVDLLKNKKPQEAKKLIDEIQRTQ